MTSRSLFAFPVTNTSEKKNKINRKNTVNAFLLRFLGGVILISGIDCFEFEFESMIILSHAENAESFV